MSTRIQRREICNIGPIQPKGGAIELIFCVGLTVGRIFLKLGATVVGIVTKLLQKKILFWPQGGAVVSQNPQKLTKFKLSLWPFLWTKILKIFRISSTRYALQLTHRTYIFHIERSSTFNRFIVGVLFTYFHYKGHYQSCIAWLLGRQDWSWWIN